MSRGIRKHQGKYLYWPTATYRQHNFSRGKGEPALGIVRPVPHSRRWQAIHYNYPGTHDIATGRTRDEAVDKLLALIGEG
jgi:hypothetical protein